MARLDPAQLAESLSEEEPCGPDLDLAFDSDYLTFFSSSAGLLPSLFFKRRDDGSGSDDFLLKEADKDVAAAFETLGELSGRTRDLRLAVRQGKLAALCRDLEGVAAVLEGVARALEIRWDEIHPQAEDGDFFMRVQTVQALDENVHVLLPLQHAALVDLGRAGQLSYRVWLLATGRLEPRAGEERPDEAALMRAIDGVDAAEFVARRDQFAAMSDAVDRIETTSLDQGGIEGAIRLEKLKDLTRSVAGVLDGFLAARDPSLASDPSAGARTQATPGAPTAGSGAAAPATIPAAVTIADRAHAARALRGACAYFERFEPSSPAVLLLQSAERLMGKPFVEVVRALLPDHSGSAAIGIGQNAFRLGVERLASDHEPAGEAADETRTEPSAPAPSVSSRPEAVALLEGVAAFLRRIEPASPLPLLIARAVELSSRDFSTLMKDLFSPSLLQSMRDDD